jgi:hypothetical protein
MTGPRRFPEIPLVPTPVSAEARATVGFKWAGENVGRRHKLGGVPDWVQPSDVPECPSCKQTMTFYGQLDSVGDEMTLADVGMVYVFVCFDCYETKSVLQSG